ncbi:hypothetical protein ACIPW9_36550 [Streptomyces sp. NPDC090052]|uniref:hypothetical protein n=1 Tax=Streptomyces sp. NPDC090052 TaxID=3365931 RepID=UPI00381EFCFB
MAVMTHAHPLPTEIHLHHLNPRVADQLVELLEDADEQAAQHNLTAAALLHAQATQLIGIRPPASGELTRCTCEGCYCTTVFDAAAARCYTSLGIEFVQCETCADEHRIYSD